VIQATVRVFRVRDGKVAKELDSIEVVGRSMDELRTDAKLRLAARYREETVSVHLEPDSVDSGRRHLVAYLRDDPHAARNRAATRRLSHRSTYVGQLR